MGKEREETDLEMCSEKVKTGSMDAKVTCLGTLFHVHSAATRDT